MLHRRFALGIARRAACAPLLVSCALRSSHSGPTHHDHSACFERELSAQEKIAFDAMVEHRPVSAVVPGKLFMRHFFAGEMTAHSIIGRMIGWVMAIGLISFSALYSGMGITSYSFLQFLLYAFVASFAAWHLAMPRLILAFVAGMLFLVAYW